MASRASIRVRELLDRPGIGLVPLRFFLGITFVFAGLQKLADPRFLSGTDPAGLHAQLLGYARTSPARGILLASSHHALLVGIAIALGEVGVGLGALLGLWTRVAAAGGMVLSASFLVGVSWHTHPYYLGPDIFSLFAWTPLVFLGAGEVLSVDHAIAIGLRERLPRRASVRAELPAMRRLREMDALVDRRTFVARAGAAVGVGVGALAVSGGVAAAGRLLSGVSGTTPGTSLAAGSPTSQTSPASPTTVATSAPAPTPTSPPARASRSVSSPAPPTTARRPNGTPIGPASAVPVGGAARFTDPRSGDPAIVLQPSAGKFVAHSAVCTHAGCTVRYAGSDLLACPCHGARFDARSGAVLRGPANQPLPAIPVTEGSDGQLYVT